MGCSQTLNCTTVIPSPIPATPVTSCSSGYTLTNGTCTAPATAANPVYSCSSGTLSGTQCYYPAYQPAGIAATGTLTPTGTAKFTNCGQHSSMTASMCATFGYPTGYVTQLTTNRCKIGSVTYNNADFLYCQPAVMVYSCPTGYTLSGTTCYPPLVTPPPTAATLTGYSCPSGSVLSGTSCIPTTSTITTYTCGAGMTLVGTSCQADPIATCTWSDTCGLYSTSAGSALPTP
jgi:conjugal transfer mating pair stabilization protein TraN